MRLFYAAYLSSENMRGYQVLVDRLIEEVPGVLRTIPHQTHHLTLAFLGEIAESDVQKCAAVLEVLEEYEAFGYSLGPPGLLMGRGRPRLIHVSVTSGGEQIHRAQTALISRLSEQLPSIDTRSKPPHITLARFKKNADKSQARRVDLALSRLLDSSQPVQDRFSSVQLVKSTLTPSGPIYEVVREAHLR